MSYNSELQQNNTELEEILEMANALPDAGGGGGVLVVTIDEDDVVSHTVTEIYAHVQNGGTAVLKDSEDLFYALHGCCADYATFEFHSDDGLVYTYQIWFDETVDFFEYDPDASDGQFLLVVTIDEERGTARFTSTDIYSHVLNGGTAVLLYGDKYLCLHHYEESMASFLWTSTEEKLITQIDIYEDGSLDEYLDVPYVTSLPEAITVTYDEQGASADARQIGTYVRDGHHVTLHARDRDYEYAGIDLMGNYASFIHVANDGCVLRCTVDQGKQVTFYEDTFTEADKTELVEAVLAALPSWEGGSY